MIQKNDLNSNSIKNNYSLTALGANYCTIRIKVQVSIHNIENSNRLKLQHQLYVLLVLCNSKILFEICFTCKKIQKIFDQIYTLQVSYKSCMYVWTKLLLLLLCVSGEMDSRNSSWPSEQKFSQGWDVNQIWWHWWWAL